MVFNPGQQGLACIGILVGAVITIPPLYLWLYNHLESQFDDNGNVSPEARLSPACVRGCFNPICLFGFDGAQDRISTGSCHYRLRLLFRWHVSPLQFRPELPTRYLSDICGLGTGWQRPVPFCVYCWVPAVCEVNICEP